MQSMRTSLKHDFNFNFGPHLPDKNMTKDRTFIANASRSVMKHNSMARVPMTAKSKNTNPSVYSTCVTMKKAVSGRQIARGKELGAASYCTEVTR